MKKQIRRLFVFLLVGVMIFVGSQPVHATAASIGTAGTNSSGSRATFPIIMEPTETITGLWTTNGSGGGQFVPGNYSTATLLTIRGTFSHIASGGQCKAGVCYYNGSYYVADLYLIRSNGSNFTTSSGGPLSLGLMSELSPDETYYGFVRNNIGSGYVYNVSIRIGVS